MATVLHAPSPPCGSNSSQQPQPQQPKLHHRSSAAALHHRTLSCLSHSTSSSSLHSLAASPSKPRAQQHVPVRRQLHFGARHSPGRASTSSASSSDDEATSPRHANRRAAILRRMDAGGRLNTAGLPPSRIPVLSPSYRSPSSHQPPRPAWGVSPTKRSTSFSFNRPPPAPAAGGSNSLRPLSIISPSSPFARTSALLSPTTATDAGPLSPGSPSPLAGQQLPSLHALERPVASGSRRTSSDHRPLPMDVDDGPDMSPSIRREYRALSDGHKLHSPFRSLSEGRPKAAKHTPPPDFLMPQPQSQPPKPQPLQRIRASFPSSTSLSGKSCASPAGSTDSRASSSRLAFEDARPSPEAFKVSLMKKGQGSMHGLARANTSTVYQAPPTPNPKLSHLHWAPPHACADRSPRSTIPRPARSFLSHSLSCRQPPPSSLARQQPLAASWSAGSESSNAASANSPAISPRHKGVDPLAHPPPPPPAPLPKSRVASMAKIQAQSDFLLAVDATMAESPERVNGLGLGGIGVGLGLTGFPGFGKASIAAAAAAAAAGGATKGGRSRSRRSGGIKRKGSHLDAPSIPNLTTFAANPASSPPSFSVPRQGGRPPFKRASYAEDVFGSKFDIVGVVGRGMSGGVVYKALEKQSGVVAAVKVSPVYGGVRDRIRHLEEVDILRTLARAPHPNVVSLLSSWEQAGRLHIHTELATGGDLASFLSLLADAPAEPTFGSALHDGPPAAGLDEARTWKVLAALSAGLAHVHALGIIHLDIKPANVLITRERTVVLTDFGTATCWPRKRPSEILHGSGMGTAAVDELSSAPGWEEREGDRGYLSAEAVNGVVSKAGDVFSLGLLMLESLTNIIPPSNGDAWTRLRTDDFTDIEAPPPSPAVSSCSAFSPPAVDSASSAFSTRSHSSYLAADSPWTESDSSLLLTPSVGGSLASPGVGPAAWASDTLTTLVKALMASDASRRPSALDIGRHPAVARAAALVASSTASPALVPEQPAFLAQVLEAARGARLTITAPASAPASDTSALDLARDLERMDVDVDLAGSGCI